VQPHSLPNHLSISSWFLPPFLASLSLPHHLSPQKLSLLIYLTIISSFLISNSQARVLEVEQAFSLLQQREKALVWEEKLEVVCLPLPLQKDQILAFEYLILEEQELVL